MEFTKERLLKIQSWSETYGPGSNVVLPAEEAEGLARIALASLEAEAVAYIIQDADARSRGEKGILRYFANISDEDINEYQITVTPLYTAPPAPVSVPDEMDPMTCHLDGVTGTYAEGWNACRDAMLQGAELVTTDYKLPDDFDFDRFNDVTWLEAVASNPHMHSPTTSTIAMVALELNRKLADGNSPVIPDGWRLVPVEPTAEMQSAAASAIRFDTTPINKLWTGNAVYKAMLAAAPQQEVK